MALRGVCGIQINLRGSYRDLHSGSYGGAEHNPFHVLVDLLASMHHPDGSIATAGFYEEVIPATAGKCRETARIPFDENLTWVTWASPRRMARKAIPRGNKLGTDPLWKKTESGGFQQDGIKTVLPSMAHTKITCCLMTRQDPDTIRHLLRPHVERHIPAGVEASVDFLTMNGKPYVMPQEHWATRRPVKYWTICMVKLPITSRPASASPSAGPSWTI